ncbi:MAG TPA: SRPBCC domain-containing protein [Candidatus Eisenbacteria bacterium]|nr:SRPBCC domain-containing protein [Candidatus Eisenbacteria bacterium]
MSSPALSLAGLTINITEEIRVKASLESTFAALLEQIGPYNERPDGVAMPLTLEPWPGGRWYRDLGNGNGHYWGVVQAIRRPTLLEICGPLFMSQPVSNNVQYRLSEEKGVTLMQFHHFGFGLQMESFGGVNEGWKHINSRIAARAESAHTH